MGQYNWISAVIISSGKRIDVRQARPGNSFWIDKDDIVYSSEDLDFTQAQELPDFMKGLDESNKKFAEQQVEYQELMNKMLSSMDAKAIADYKAKIDEREYWRKLRVDIFLEYSRREEVESTIEALNVTNEIIDVLYKQDKKFFND